MSAYIRTLPPTDVPFGRDMECVRCVACATTRLWSAFFFFFFVHSFQLELFQSHERRVVRCACFALALWTPCFSCAVVNRWTHLPLDILCRNKNAHMSVACCCFKDGWGVAFLCSVAWDGMLVFDMVSFSILRARCHNHNTSSDSQVVEILRFLRDVGRW